MKEVKHNRTDFIAVYDEVYTENQCKELISYIDKLKDNSILLVYRNQNSEWWGVMMMGLDIRYGRSQLHGFWRFLKGRALAKVHPHHWDSRDF